VGAEAGELLEPEVFRRHARKFRRRIERADIGQGAPIDRPRSAGKKLDEFLTSDLAGARRRGNGERRQ